MFRAVATAQRVLSATASRLLPGRAISILPRIAAVSPGPMIASLRGAFPARSFFTAVSTFGRSAPSVRSFATKAEEASEKIPVDALEEEFDAMEESWIQIIEAYRNQNGLNPNTEVDDNGEVVEAPTTPAPLDGKKITDEEYEQALTELAELYSSTGAMEGAESVYQDLIDFIVSKRGEKDSSLGILHNNLAQALMHNGNYEDAELNSRKAIDLVAAAKGNKAPELVPCIENMAHIMAVQDKYKDSSKLFKRVLDMSLAMYSRDTPAVAIAYSRYGNSLIKLKEYAEAEKQLKESVSLFQNLVKDDAHQDLNEEFADALLFLGRNYHAAGNTVESLAAVEKAANITRKNPDHDQRASNLAEIASTYSDLDNDALAENVYKEIIEIRKQNDGPDSLECADAQTDLAELLAQTEHFEEAESILAPLSKSLLEKHPESAVTAETLQMLGSLYAHLKRPAEALPLLKKALAIYEECGPEEEESYDAVAEMIKELTPKPPKAEKKTDKKKVDSKKSDTKAKK